MKILTVLKSGGDFDLHHVKKIQEMLDRHHQDEYELYCLTDYSKDMMPTDKIQHISLQYDWEGWWSKIEMFSIDSNELFLYMDLDTVITGNLKHFFEVEETSFSPIQDVYQRLENKERMGSGLFLFRPNYLRFLFEKFRYTPQKYMKQFRGDQDFIENSIDLIHYEFLQNVFPNQIFSFKGDLCNPPKTRNPENFIGIPNNSKIIFFHGIPRPSDPQINYLNQASN